MLQTIRDRAQGWIAWAIVILISIPFALWGIQSYLGVGGEPVAAEVNGIELTARDLDRRVQQARFELRQRLGAAYDPAAYDDKNLRAEVLDGMVREALLLDEARELGLRVADQDIQVQILSDPSFQSEGRFDKAAYERALQYQGMSPEMYESQLRQQMAAGQLVRAVSSSAFATSHEVSQYQRLMGQKRELTFVKIPRARYDTDSEVPDAEVKTFYDAHPDRFRSPEQVKLDYIVLDTESVASKVQVSEEDLRSAYEADQARFAQPERREVRHILLKVPDGADEAGAGEVLAKIQDLRKRILAGESFEAIAKEHSMDPGSAANGGSLGIIESGIMVPAFDQAAFAAEQGKVTEPVRTQFGYHLIDVTKILPAQVKPFDEARDQLKSELAKQRAEGLYYDLGERLANITYESPDSLEPAAEELGLRIQHSDWLSRTGDGEGILSSPKVLAAAFSDEVKNEGRNSDMIEPEREQLRAIVLHVVDHREASVRPLAEVKDDIVAEIRKQRAEKAAADAAEDIAQKLRETKEWVKAGAELEPEAPGLVDRQSDGAPQEILDAAFKLPAPQDGDISVGTVALDSGDAAVVRLSRVEDGEVTNGAKGAPAPESYVLAQVMGRQIVESMLRDMESRAKIERKDVTSDQEP